MSPLTPVVRACLELAAATACKAHGPAHDFLHVLRVVALAERLAKEEGGDLDVVIPAALLHELVNLPKNHPDSKRSGELCAEVARELLVSLDYPGELVDRICQAIADHGFSLGADPPSREASILQDADRLDAIGAVGIARCFATAGELGSALYDATDPRASQRALDDKRFAFDHFAKKLFRIEDRLHTEAARRLASTRMERMRGFVEGFTQELDEARPA